METLLKGALTERRAVHVTQQELQVETLYPLQRSMHRFMQK